MMSQTSANVDENVNPVYADVVKVTTVEKLVVRVIFLRCLMVGRIGPFRISSEFLRIRGPMDGVRL